MKFEFKCPSINFWIRIIEVFFFFFLSYKYLHEILDFAFWPTSSQNIYHSTLYRKEKQPGTQITCEFFSPQVSSCWLRIAIGKGEVADVFGISLWETSRNKSRISYHNLEFQVANKVKGTDRPILWPLVWIRLMTFSYFCWKKTECFSLQYVFPFPLMIKQSIQISQSYSHSPTEIRVGRTIQTQLPPRSPREIGLIEPQIE